MLLLKGAKNVLDCQYFVAISLSLLTLFVSIWKSNVLQSCWLTNQKGQYCVMYLLLVKTKSPNHLYLSCNYFCAHVIRKIYDFDPCVSFGRYCLNNNTSIKPLKLDKTIKIGFFFPLNKLSHSQKNGRVTIICKLYILTSCLPTKPC